MSSELELLREQNEDLMGLCQTMAELLAGMMKAIGQDHPELMELPHYVNGQKIFEEYSLHFRKIKGEG